MSLNTREQFLICAVILLASGFLLYEFVVSPELRYIYSARFHSNSHQDLLETKAEQTQRHSMFRDTVQQLETAVTETKGLLFSKDEAIDFLRLLPQLISQTGNVLISMTPHDVQSLSLSDAAVYRAIQEQQISEIEAERACMRMPVQMAIRGKYSEVIRFFEQLEERKQLVTISDIGIATGVADPAEVHVSLTLNLYVCEYRAI